MIQHLNHTFDPYFQSDSKILILGSFPSPKSREVGFYYGHPSNRFWKVMEGIFDVQLNTIKDKKIFLSNYKIALWDVVKSCDIEGAKDSSIQNVTVNDISSLIDQSNITSIFTTGKKAYELYQKYIFPTLKIECTYLPSTSPMNAQMKLNDLLEIYKKELLPQLK